MGGRVTLRDYFERLLAEHHRQHAHEKVALDLALDATNARLASMNEFRAQAEDRTATYLTRVEFDAYRDGTEQRQRWIVTTLLAVVALAASVIIAVLTTA